MSTSCITSGPSTSSTSARNALAEVTDPDFAKYRDAAGRHARAGELEIDAGAVVSNGDDEGAYVMAWLWVRDDELAP